ncbi:MAG: hypothetical protein ACC652_00445 [Acidimicrobiales bacterium]
MKKGRHRRYEEARKFKERESNIEDMDLDDDSFFPAAVSDDEDESDDGDPYADLAAKYNAEPSEEDYE